MSELSAKTGALKSTIRRYIAQDGSDHGETIYRMYIGSNAGAKGTVYVQEYGNSTLEKAKSTLTKIYNNLERFHDKGYDYKTIEQHTTNEINRLAKQGLSTTDQDLRNSIAMSLPKLKKK